MAFGNLGEQLNLAILIKTVGDLGGIQQTRAGLQGLEGSMASLNSVAAGLATNLALMGGAMAGEIISEGTKKYMTMAEAMRLIAFRTNQTYEEMQDWYDQLDNLRSLTLAAAYSDDQLAEALAAISAEGRGAAGSAEIVAAAMSVAVVSTRDLSEETTTLENILSEWGLTADDASDVAAKMVAAYQATGASMSEIETALSRAAGTLKLFNVDMDEGVSLMATMIDITGGNSRAVNSLMTAIAQMSDESQKAGRIFKEYYGTSMMEMIQSGTSLTDILMMIAQMPPDLLTKMFPSSQSINALKQLADNLDELQQTTAAVRAATGETVPARQAEIMESGEFKEVKTIEQLQREFYNFQLRTGKEVFNLLKDILPWVKDFLVKTGLYTGQEGLIGLETKGLKMTTVPGLAWSGAEYVAGAVRSQTGYEGLLHGPAYIEPGLAEWVSIEPSGMPRRGNVSVTINNPLVLDERHIDLLTKRITEQIRRLGV